MRRTSEQQRDFRQEWRKRLAEFLADISDVQKTEGDWLSSEDVRGYDEDVCGYFDDMMSGNGLDWAVKEDLLSVAEAQTLQAFHVAFAALVDSLPKDNSYRDLDIVGSGRWAELAKVAGQTYQALGSQLRAKPR